MNKLYLDYNHIFFYSQKKNKYFIINNDSKKIYKINKEVYDLLTKCNGIYSIDELVNDYENTEAARNTINALLQLGVLVIDNYKKRFYEKCYKESKEMLLPMFDTIYILITSKCNLACSFCSSGTLKSNKYLSLSEYERIADEIKTAYGNEPAICFTGGEPLLRDDFFEIARIFHNHGFKLCLLTNGTLINNKNLSKLNIFSDIAISLDSIIDEQHEKFRGNIKGCYTTTINALILLSKESASKIWIQVAVSYENINQMKKIAEFAANQGLYGVRYSIIHPIGKAEFDNTYTLKSDYYSRYYKEILDIKSRFKGLHINESFTLNKRDNDLIGNSNCRLHNSCLINHDGKVSICPGFLGENNFTTSSLAESSFIDVVSSSNLIKYYKNNIHEDIEPCKNCGIRYLCLGGCRGEKQICNPDKKRGIIECIEKSLT